MPSITINGVKCEFTPGQMIMQVANAHGLAIPQYCYHDGLSIVASCRICLGEIWAPNARAGGRIEPFMGGKLMPTCQTAASDGMVVHTDSPKSVANQKAVMEYLLINHPLDCPVCDQAGECFLQDYSYQYGRGVSRFEEQKVKNPKKDVGPHVLLYADRCIMCTRCVRFTREVSGTGELMVAGRGNKEEIDVFPGVALDNDLSANVIDLCPVGALLDKDFLFAQRVWFLKSTASIDGITASGDNIWIEHNEGKVYRIKPRANPKVNKWWITDEVRYGWKHVHDDGRLSAAMRREYGALAKTDFEMVYHDVVSALGMASKAGRRVMVMVSPMLSCEEAWLLAKLARTSDPAAVLVVGPVPVRGEDRVYPPTLKADDAKAFVARAEKAPNARGVRRVLGALGGEVLEFERFGARLAKRDVGVLIVTGNYPSEWATKEMLGAINAARATAEGGARAFTIVIDTLESALTEGADVVLPGATWAEKAGTFENARNLLQAFEQAIPVLDGARSEGQIALDLLVQLGAVQPDTQGVHSYSIVDEGPGQVPAAAETHLGRTKFYNAGAVRAEMAGAFGSLGVFATGVEGAMGVAKREADVAVVEL